MYLKTEIVMFAGASAAPFTFVYNRSTITRGGAKTVAALRNVFIRANFLYVPNVSFARF